MNIKKLRNIKISNVVYFLFFAWFIFTFLIFPNINTIKETFYADGHFTMEYVRKITTARPLKGLKNSLILAVTLTITVNIIGTFIVLACDYFKIWGSKILKIVYSSTLIYGGIVLVSGYKLVYGDQGFVTKFLMNIFPNMNQNWFTGYVAVAFVMSFACTSNHIMFLSNAVKGLDYQTIEAAKNMGASQWYILRRVVLPTLAPTFFSITILTFLTGLGATAAPMVLGGKEFETITPLILAFSKSQTSKPLATTLALILGIATFILLTVLIVIERKGNYMSVSKVKSKLEKQKIHNPVANTVVHIVAYVLFVIYLIPMVLIILFSFTDAQSISSGTLSLERFTLSNYAQVFSSLSGIKPYIVSILYGLVAAALVLAICLLAARLIHKYNNKLTTALEFGLLIPWIIPSTLIAIGLIVSFNQPNPLVFNMVLYTTPVILLIGYILIKIPFTLRMTKSVFFSIDSQIEEAGRNLGANPLYTFVKVVLPIILPSVMGVFALNFIAILSDYDLTAFLYRPELKPLGIVIKLSTDPESSGDAKAMALVYSVILMIISTIVLYFVYREKKPKSKRKIQASK